MMPTEIIQSGNSQAIRIPRGMRTDKKDYCINKIGDIFVAYPAEDPWSTVRQVIGTFPDGFMDSREQPSQSDVPDRADM